MQKQEKDYTGFLGDCSENQLKVLAAFKEEVKKMGITDPKYDDGYLLRFCRARKFKLEDIMTMWKNFINWRKENEVDTILTNFDFKELPELRPFYYHMYFRTDKQGRPVYIERLGKLKIDNLYKITTKERLIRYYIQSYERLLGEIMPACSKKAGHRIEQSMTIFDLEGVSITGMFGKVKEFVQLASKVGQDYYPETLGNMIIVNAPLLFSGIWAVIKPWIDEKTRAKIKILGSGYQKELFTYVDPENLPDFLGGKVPASEYGEFMEKEQGPWLMDEYSVKSSQQKQDKDIKQIETKIETLTISSSDKHGNQSIETITHSESHDVVKK